MGETSPDLTTGGTVFLVEDDTDLRRSLEMVLTSAGLPTRAYATPAELLADWDPDRPGCLVLDLRTPQFDALELHERLVAAGSLHPFLVISAHGSVPSVALAMRRGAVDFLPKPLDHRLLIERVREALARDAERRPLLEERRWLQQRLAELTRRENEVLSYVLRGRSGKQIAKRLDISVKTVEVHRSNIVKKMRVDSVIELVRLLTLHSLSPGGASI